MKKGLIVISLILVISLSFLVFAEPNQSQNRDRNFSIDGSIQNNSNNVKNMTFGQCVSDAAKLRNDCYAQGKQTLKNCTQASKQTKNKLEAKACQSSGKNASKVCQQTFKDSKQTCIQETKPGFWQRMRYSFK